MLPSPEATAAVRRAVRAALAAEAGGEPPGVDLGAVNTEDLLAAVRRHRVTALLAAQGVQIGLRADVGAALHEAREQARLRSLRQLRRLVEVARVLEAASMPVLFVKGPCLAVQTTGDFTARDSGDVDLLVQPADASTALTALEEAGWRALPGLPSDVESWGWRYLLATYCEVALHGPLGAVDLHWRLDPTRRGLPGFTELWARRATVVLAGREFATLSPEDALVHSCHHAAKDEWRTLRSLVDIHRMLRDESLAESVRGRVSRRTVAVVEATVGLPPGGGAVPPGRPRTDRLACDRALLTQAGPLIPETGQGRGTYRAVRYRLASGRGWADSALTVAFTMLPPAAFEDIHSRTAYRSLSGASWRRLRYLARCAVGDARAASEGYR